MKNLLICSAYFCHHGYQHQGRGGTVDIDINLTLLAVDIDQKSGIII